MDRRGRDRVARRRTPGTSGRRGRALSRLDPAEHEVAEARRSSEPRGAVGSADDRSAAHPIDRDLPVRRTHLEPAHPVRVSRGGRRYQRSLAQGRPRGVLAGEPRLPDVDLQDSSGGQVAQHPAAERARAHRRRCEVLLRAVRERGAAVLPVPRDRRNGDARQVHAAGAPVTPNVLFPQNVAESVTVIFAREVLEEDGDLKKRLVGTGPYILKEHTRKVRVVLTRNPDYYDKGRPYVDEIVILSTPDAATRLAAFRTGQSDILPVNSLSEVEVARKTNPNAIVQEYKNVLAPFGVALAQDKPPFNDIRVRRAISMAIDRQKQVDTVFEGHGIPGWGVPYIYYQDKAPTLKELGPWWQYRPAEAKKLMTEAGHGAGFETTLFYFEYWPQMTSQVQLVQQDLKKNLNINIKIQKLDYTTYYGRYVE